MFIKIFILNLSSPGGTVCNVTSTIPESSERPIRSDEGPTLETSAFQSLYGGQFTLSTPLINQIFVYHYPTDAAPQFP